MRVCVIGGGVSGLCCASYLKLEPSIGEIVVYEASGQIGGTWVYTDQTGSDQYGAPIFTSMYKHLRTNLPIQAMEINAIKWAKDTPCFPDGSVVLKYIEDFACKYHIQQYIKFHVLVTKVSRTVGEWIVAGTNLQLKTNFTEKFDAVFICSGHYSEPDVPKIQGSNVFKGQTLHSHDYRSGESFKNKNVAVVGLGPSGVDIALDLRKVAKAVFLSHHSRRLKTDHYPSDIILKPDLKLLKERSVIFMDDTEEEIDVLLHCTGYRYNLTFLDDSCGLEVSKYRIYPLYKHLVNVNHPTMFLMNTAKGITGFPALSLEAQYCVKALAGGFALPPKGLMLQNIQKEIDEKRALRFREKDFHTMAHKVIEYCDGLSSEAMVESIPPFIGVMTAVNIRAIVSDYTTFRDYIYEVIDDCTITQRLPNQGSPKVIRAGLCDVCSSSSILDHRL